MDAGTRIEEALATAIAAVEDPSAPPGLAAAVRHAVFPGGARIRPRLCLAVAQACGDDAPPVTDAAAAAIELLHCASLVHDDLPCFDDAEVRRGRPSVHRQFGEALAVLAGDALIVLAFQALVRVAETSPLRLPALLLVVGRCAGAPAGIVAGQAWECERQVVLADYQRAKTGALFVAATVAGAVAAGAESDPWRAVGERLGEAYQIADDIRDVVAHPEEIGKPVGRDAVLDRPSAARQLGLHGAVTRFEELLGNAAGAVPACAGAAALRALIQSEAARLLPKNLARRAA